MANTYTQILLHLVFAVKNRDALIPPHQEGQIHSYMAQTLNNIGHKTIIIGGVEDHVHILFYLNPALSLSETVRELKTATTNFINAHHLCLFHFEWQKGYSCFSYSHSLKQKVYDYILNQHEHHHGQTLQAEIKKFMDGFGIEYDEKYIFKVPD